MTTTTTTGTGMTTPCDGTAAVRASTPEEKKEWEVHDPFLTPPPASSSSSSSANRRFPSLTTLFTKPDNSSANATTTTSTSTTTPSTSTIKETPQPSLIFFDAETSKRAIQKLSRDAPVPNRHGYILGDEFVSTTSTPLLVFINTRSGPQQGLIVANQLRRLLNPIQVWDLGRDGDPATVLESFCDGFSKLRLLVCGGDGTVSWILSCLEGLKREYPWPAMAILPLGTGNDLARVHGWGGGYNNDESLLSLLEQVQKSYVSLLDRWELSVEETHRKRGSVVKGFINYFGVGVDAQAALQVHMLRESKPKLFFSRFINKAWYAIAGAAEDLFNASCAGFSQKITLIADGVEIPLPVDSQGIIFLNIDSYMGGVPLWGLGERRVRRYGSARDLCDNSFAEGYGLTYPMRRNSTTRRMDSIDRIESSESLDTLSTMTSPSTKNKKTHENLTSCNLPSSCQDGMLDVVSISSAFHLGQIRVGLSNAHLICQCHEATIKTKRTLAAHVDGEPWKQFPALLKIKKKKDPAVMLHRAPDDGGGVEVEVSNLLDWAEDRGVIDKKVHGTLMREFSRRIEKRVRNKRIGSKQENLVGVLKRALQNSSTY